MMMDCINNYEKNKRAAAQTSILQDSDFHTFTEAETFFKSAGNLGIDSETKCESLRNKGYVINDKALVTPIFDSRDGVLFEIRDLTNNTNIMLSVPYDKEDWDSKGFVIQAKDGRATLATDSKDAFTRLASLYVESDPLWQACCRQKAPRAAVQYNLAQANSLGKELSI